MPWPTGAQPIAGTQPMSQPDAQPAQEPSTLQKLGTGALDLATGAGKGFASTANNIGHVFYPDFIAKHLTGAPSAQQQESYFKPKNTAEAIGKGAEQVGEFFLPGGAEEDVAAKLAPKLGKLAPAVKPAVRTLMAEETNQAQGGTPGMGAALSAGGEALGSGLRAAAPRMAESALKIGKADRINGRSIGQTALDYTKSIRPENITREADESIGKLTREAKAKIPSGATMDLAPVRQAGTNAMADINAQNVPSTIEAGRGLQDVLNTQYSTGKPIPQIVPAEQALSLRTGLGKYLPQGTWNPETANRIAPVRNQMYGEMNEQIGKNFPSIREADKPIASLIPVSRHAESISREGSALQRGLGRFGAHSGALAGGIAGGFEGRREGGIPGMLAGGAMGVLAPELIASPEGQMGAARIMHNAGGLRPVVASALQLNRPKENQ